MEIATGQRKYLDETEIGHAALVGAVSTFAGKRLEKAMEKCVVSYVGSKAIVKESKQEALKLLQGEGKAVSTAGDKAVVNAAKSLRKKKVELYETFGKIFIQTGDQVGTDVIHRNIDKDKK